MPHETHRLHMQEYGPAPRTRICNGFVAATQSIIQVRPVAGNIFQRGAMREVGRYPPAGRPHRNADAIILTQEDDGHGQMLIRSPAGGVKRALRCGMVGRRIAERT